MCGLFSCEAFDPWELVNTFPEFEALQMVVSQAVHPYARIKSAFVDKGFDIAFYFRTLLFLNFQF